MRGLVGMNDAQCQPGGQMRNIDVERLTVGDNIDRKIEMLRAEIDRLEMSKATLKPLLNMRIVDIQQAMNF